MNHTKQPAAIYDLTTLASSTARYNVKSYSGDTQRQVQSVHDEALALLEESNSKPVLPHNDPEAVRLANQYAKWVHAMINGADQSGRADARRIAHSRELVSDFQTRLSQLRQSEKLEWYVDKGTIDEMFGLPLTSDSARKVMMSELEEWGNYGPPIIPEALREPVTNEEVQGLSDVVRNEIFGVHTFDADVYVDSDSGRHYLFWTPTAETQECAVPHDYSLADHLRFHFPHNDLHLSHLNALSDHGVNSYVDYMDERAFFEAVAVHSEWALLQRLQKDVNGEVSNLLHNQLSTQRRNLISPEELKSWLIANRGYECRLRASRLVADVLTLHDDCSFEEAIHEGMGITGLNENDTKAETRKYFFLPGLGAVYSMGYRALVDVGIENPRDAYEADSTTRTWHQFPSNTNE